MKVHKRYNFFREAAYVHLMVYNTGCPFYRIYFRAPYIQLSSAACSAVFDRHQVDFQTTCMEKNSKVSTSPLQLIH